MKNVENYCNICDQIIALKFVILATYMYSIMIVINILLFKTFIGIQDNQRAYFIHNCNINDTKYKIDLTGKM